MAKKQPGTMLYFDIRPCLKRLSTQEKGILFEAILDYGEFGAVPELDGALGVAWDFIQPRLDRDRERYGEQVLQRNYAAYSREAKRRGDTPLSFEQWKLRPTTDDNGSLPTTTTTSSTTSTSSTTPTSTPTGGGRQSRPKTEEQKFEDMRKQRMRMLQGGK